MWLFAIFIAWPLVEIGLFVTLGGWLGLWPTLAVVLLSGVLGVAVLRRMGMRSMAELRRGMSGLQDPAAPIAHGVMTILAGILLILPGFLTDALGVLLLVPPLQLAVFRWLTRHVRMAGPDFRSGFRRGFGHEGFGPRHADEAPPERRQPDGGIVIDGEFEELEPPVRPTHPTSGWTRH